MYRLGSGQAQSDDTCLVDGGRLQGTELQRDMVRTSAEDRTMPVAGVTLAAMDLFVTGLSWPVYTQPASVHPRSYHQPCWTHCH